MNPVLTRHGIVQSRHEPYDPTVVGPACPDGKEISASCQIHGTACSRAVDGERQLIPPPTHKCLDWPMHRKHQAQQPSLALALAFLRGEVSSTVSVIKAKHIATQLMLQVQTLQNGAIFAIKESRTQK
ncbi:unnamed protein product [Cercospora beticola]|nr:unnamed protein product [Cercospora beticola]